MPYDRRWPAEFQRVGAPVRGAMGATALRIDHIGSTAVPGLAAKDVIDMQVTVQALDVAALLAVLTPLRYTLLEGIDGDHIPPGRHDPPEEWRKYMFRGPEDQRRVNLHVRQARRANQRYPLLFRDNLRADAGAMGAYARIKEALARLHPNDADAYYDVKDPVCDITVAAAELWAVQTRYTLGPSDA